MPVSILKKDSTAKQPTSQSNTTEIGTVLTATRLLNQDPSTRRITLTWDSFSHPAGSNTEHRRKNFSWYRFHHNDTWKAKVVFKIMSNYWQALWKTRSRLAKKDLEFFLGVHHWLHLLRKVNWSFSLSKIPQVDQQLFWDISQVRWTSSFTGASAKSGAHTLHTQQPGNGLVDPNSAFS